MDMKSLTGFKDAVDIAKLVALKDSLNEWKGSLKNERVDEFKDSIATGTTDTIEKLKRRMNKLEDIAEDNKKSNKMMIVVICIIAVLPVLVAVAFYFGMRSASDRAEDLRKFNEGREMLRLKRQERFAKVKSKHANEDEACDEIFED